MRAQSLLLLIVAGIAAFGGARMVLSLAPRSGFVAQNPFIATIHVRSVPAGDPARAIEYHHVYAVRSDGSYVKAGLKDSISTELSNIVERTIVLVPERLMIIVSDPLGIKTTMPLREEEQLISPRRRYDPTCAVDPFDARQFRVLGSTALLGFTVIHMVETGGSVQYWKAPELNCFPLRKLFEFRGMDGKISATTEETAVSIIPGPPPDPLFDASAYREKKPSEYELARAREAATRLGQPPDRVTLPERMRDAFRSKDAQYDERHASRP